MPKNQRFLRFDRVALVHISRPCDAGEPEGAACRRAGDEAEL